MSLIKIRDDNSYFIKKPNIHIIIVLYLDNIPWSMGYKAVDDVMKSFGYVKPVHAVVIDAGSTGSRVLAFTFHEAYFGNTTPIHFIESISNIYHFQMAI